ncbi:MAG: pilus assembly protein N-terminal domain-containing protein [Rhizobiales bacterium]|nr:pilus assembly protein N-terminal domain-containing protein [Hyphomicrobiales bacterium]MBO6699204.1 pilus assembly protein N-terminal domain-containing protein [Hyphomicrobiales bacterium]MBO6736742.1 pilus assembly protein N-terminal domain-containing protein [Hyphomicrobiales bacterium]MBO6912184.1 pilus assembly protein N-terminal domain-containing protein [Hyphomicrobiales bacterium]MBO6956679.1 pilus assembly protein N-terminal domain-containing protein [Hyphomicrobiales bacterium]
MRFGSRSVPFRVVLASVSLAGLGIAAALPSIATDVTRNGVDPIITQSTSKVDTSEPTRTDLPSELAASTTDTPRQILPHSPEGAASTAVHDSSMEEPTLGADADSIVVQGLVDTPIETEIAAASLDDFQDGGLTQSMSGEASSFGGIVLALDHARVMRVVGDVSTIVIGNPAIADASMPDPGTIILTGKSYGETNLVMLDEEGAVLAEETLRVTVRGQSLVSVYRGVQRTTLSCAPTCEIRPTPGDAPEMVEAGLNAFQARNRAALEAVRGGE